MTNVVRPCRSDRRPSWIIASLSLSRLDVASSRSRIRGFGENRARDRDALALAAREPDAALADDRVVPLLELLDELVGVRDPADALDVRRASRAGVP